MILRQVFGVELIWAVSYGRFVKKTGSVQTMRMFEVYCVFGIPVPSGPARCLVRPREVWISCEWPRIIREP